ncbi:hypothetical protein PCYB_002420 [Plasmodium cynomolgi strain B]|uniref:Variable surface protein n=1 Tax=Plasmodium cynomolgi (strain B) TaxID=1120755 RepID=K6UNH5_PLACD|nr:hypothetical protein PCYB_002420 [Plasmodium cynomolgi strain B]GAB69493.1 hypothetical protein PCYB_002420 [Plasmodium cynomolgi strain B]
MVLFNYENIRLFPTFDEVYNINPEIYESKYNSECDYINELFDKEYNGRTFKTACIKIADFIQFYFSNENDSDDNIDACIYLNYVIHKEISDFNKSYDKTKEFYDKLIKKFEEKSFILRKYCKESIQHLDKNIYENVGKLYTLYSIFEKFKITYPQRKTVKKWINVFPYSKITHTIAVTILIVHFVTHC